LAFFAFYDKTSTSSYSSFIMIYEGYVLEISMYKFTNADVAAVFESYSTPIKKKLLFLRQMIFNVAAETEGVGQLEETLKWGQPSYLTVKPKSGSTIRIDQVKSHEGQYAMYFHCQTTLVDTFKEIYANEFRFEGNRSIIFNLRDQIPMQALSHCISLDLT